ncbi:MAG: lysylphosphatidylglycerol synthetase family protein [Cyclobacteriaceae bacterium]|nr:lysylphosphatidylglycerol synthetase family protein [Cyclobacteriaceae bacterium]
MKKEKALFQTQKKIIFQIAFSLLFVALGIFFLQQERSEIYHVKEAIEHANVYWLSLGVVLVFLFVLVQGFMYVFSFKAIHKKISLLTGVLLFLKRNLISVFLPAGLLTNMAFFNNEVERKEKVNKTEIYVASTIFSISSILTGILFGLPALVWLYFKSSLSNDLLVGFGILIVLVLLIVGLIVDLIKKGRVYRFIEKHVPFLFQVINDFTSRDKAFSKAYLLTVVLLSVGIELIGVAHLYIAVKAVGGVPSIAMALVGYSIVVLILSSSPFLRGIGAIEVALSFALTVFGFTTAAAISIVFIFRFFEFWGVLLLGLGAFLSKRNNLFIRLLPTLLLFGLGIVNIVSAITPALPDRLRPLLEVIPLYAIHASTWLVFFAGFAMLAISVYLLRGLRNAWRAALVLSALSLVAHLTKGIDWEEALLSGVVVLSLLYQRRYYFIKTDIHLIRRSLLPGLIVVATALLFGTIGFYFIKPVHFNADFTLWDSFQEAVTSFLLLNVDLTPVTRFGHQFLYGMHMVGILTMGFVLFLLLRPFIHTPERSEEEERTQALQLLEKYGNSSLDYFKTYFDKYFWFRDKGEGFVAYKVTRTYALALGNPVCDNKTLGEVIKEFDAYSSRVGLRTAYYRIPERSKEVYEMLGKKLLPIGEEATLNLETWTLEGKHRAAFRNIVNKFTKMGYVFKANVPPHKAPFLQQLHAVSESWLRDTQRSEFLFSQGMFSEPELKEQVLFTLEDPEGKIVAFVNQIPDGLPGKTNFDLMRKTEDAPNGAMDFVFVKMFEFMKEQGFKKCDLGMVPLSGIDKPNNLQEQVIKLAYEKIGQFGHYKSLRSFKQKFDPEWHMMYMAYNSSIDLIFLPSALEKVVKSRS